ncbi:hypothetical protein DVH24_034190 [Malus domestica]|uniref:Uncharacterized protein n=1 Tax=Malus domestica TaxID=3750 RepID=A0A498ICV8_MALDO|nr:hypothetical protein DVH24_034190 [Malus domestica]
MELSLLHAQSSTSSLIHGWVQRQHRAFAGGRKDFDTRHYLLTQSQLGGLSNTMSKFFKSKSDNFGKMQMSCDWEALCIQEVSSVSEDLEMYVLRLISSGTKYKHHFE